MKKIIENIGKMNYKDISNDFIEEYPDYKSDVVTD